MKNLLKGIIETKFLNINFNILSGKSSSGLRDSSISWNCSFHVESRSSHLILTEFASRSGTRDQSARSQQIEKNIDYDVYEKMNRVMETI